MAKLSLFTEPHCSLWGIYARDLAGTEQGPGEKAELVPDWGTHGLVPGVSPESRGCRAAGRWAGDREQQFLDDKVRVLLKKAILIVAHLKMQKE